MRDLGQLSARLSGCSSTIHGFSEEVAISGVSWATAVASHLCLGIHFDLEALIVTLGMAWFGGIQ